MAIDTAFAYASRMEMTGVYCYHKGWFLGETLVQDESVVLKCLYFRLKYAALQVLTGI